MLDNYNKNENPFKVPENYFADFEAKLMETIDTNVTSTQKKKNVPMWRKITPWAASIAAVVVGVAFIVQFPTQGKDVKTDDTASNYSMLSAISDDYYSFLESETAEWTYDEMIYDDFD